jgi:hypothetical protein
VTGALRSVYRQTVAVERIVAVWIVVPPGDTDVWPMSMPFASNRFVNVVPLVTFAKVMVRPASLYEVVMVSLFERPAVGRPNSSHVVNISVLVPPAFVRPSVRVSRRSPS